MSMNPVKKIGTNPSDEPPSQEGTSEPTSSQSGKYLFKQFCFCCNHRLDKVKKTYAPSDNQKNLLITYLRCYKLNIDPNDTRLFGGDDRVCDNCFRDALYKKKG